MGTTKLKNMNKHKKTVNKARSIEVKNKRKFCSFIQTSSLKPESLKSRSRLSKIKIPQPLSYFIISITYTVAKSIFFPQRPHKQIRLHILRNHQLNKNPCTLQSCCKIGSRLIGQCNNIATSCNLAISQHLI